MTEDLLKPCPRYLLTYAYEAYDPEARTWEPVFGSALARRSPLHFLECFEREVCHNAPDGAAFRNFHLQGVWPAPAAGW